MKKFVTILPLISGLIPLFGAEVIIPLSSEQNMTFEVSENESFIEVVAVIQDVMTTLDETSANVPFTMSIEKKGAGFQIKASKTPSHKEPRNADTLLTKQNKEDITFIIKTMANGSLGDLAMSQNALSKAGDRIERIYPLTFFEYILTHEELRVCIRNIHSNSTMYGRFESGIMRSLKEEYSLGNIKDSRVIQFANRVGISPQILLPLVHQQKWREFIHTPINLIPREGNPNRYDI